VSLVDDTSLKATEGFDVSKRSTARKAFEYTGDTGKYKGSSASDMFVGVTQVNWQDGTSTGYATWNR